MATQSPFACYDAQLNFPPFDTTWTYDTDNNHKRQVEFLLNKLPTMLERHSSAPASLPCAKSRKGNLRHQSFLMDFVGIIVDHRIKKSVSFDTPCTLVYKAD